VARALINPQLYLQMSHLVILTPHQQKTASIIFKLRDEFGQTFVIVT
jgi:hypothetical protein